MVLSDIDICSNAIVRLGDDPINSFDTSDVGRACAAIYPFVKLTVLTSYPWFITMRKSDLLPRSLEAPPTEYKYAYTMPPDRLTGMGPRKVFSDKAVPAGNQPFFNRFELYGDQILSSSEQILVDYQVDVAEQKLPFYIVELLTLAMATEIALADTDKQPLAELFMVKAWGTPKENRRGGQFKVASRLDSQAQRPPRSTNFPLTAARQGN